MDEEVEPAEFAAVVMYAIYDHPLDYPNDFVVRVWHVHSTARGGAVATGIVWTAKTLDEARLRVPCDMVCIPRSPDDHSVIVETWV